VCLKSRLGEIDGIDALTTLLATWDSENVKVCCRIWQVCVMKKGTGAEIAG
jgi:hypothetical protein